MNCKLAILLNSVMIIMPNHEIARFCIWISIIGRHDNHNLAFSFPESHGDALFLLEVQDVMKNV